MFTVWGLKYTWFTSSLCVFRFAEVTSPYFGRHGGSDIFHCFCVTYQLILGISGPGALASFVHPHCLLGHWQPVSQDAEMANIIWYNLQEYWVGGNNFTVHACSEIFLACKLACCHTEQNGCCSQSSVIYFKMPSIGL